VISSPDFLNVQHNIHDVIAPDARRFEYPEGKMGSWKQEHRWSIVIEGEMRSK
jgi:hypothetical protein